MSTRPAADPDARPQAQLLRGAVRQYRQHRRPRPSGPAAAAPARQRRVLPRGTVSPKRRVMTATPAGITYADYLKLDQLLSAQQPRSDLHDEMLFIVIHQTKELWMKELLHELRLAIGLVQTDRFAEAYKAMARISRIQAVMTLSWDVLSTLTPVDYLEFRNVLGTSSGFQSAQFREIEFRLGLKEPNFVNHYEEGSAERERLRWRLRAESSRSLPCRARARGLRSWRQVSARARSRLAPRLSRLRALVRPVRARRETGRYRRRAGLVAAQACADG